MLTATARSGSTSSCAIGIFLRTGFRRVFWDELLVGGREEDGDGALSPDVESVEWSIVDRVGWGGRVLEWLRSERTDFEIVISTQKNDFCNHYHKYSYTAEIGRIVRCYLNRQ